MLLAGALHHSVFPVLCYLCGKCLLLRKEVIFLYLMFQIVRICILVNIVLGQLFEVDSIIFKAEDWLQLKGLGLSYSKGDLLI